MLLVQSRRRRRQRLNLCRSAWPSVPSVKVLGGSGLRFPSQWHTRLEKGGDDNDLVRASAAVVLSAVKSAKEKTPLSSDLQPSVALPSKNLVPARVTTTSRIFFTLLTGSTITSGKDTINASLAGPSGGLIAGDGSGLNPNADLIDLEANAAITGLTVKGQNGADTMPFRAWLFRLSSLVMPMTRSPSQLSPLTPHWVVVQVLTPSL